MPSYANALEMLFIVDRLTPWTDTDYRRIGLFEWADGLDYAVVSGNFHQMSQIEMADALFISGRGSFECRRKARVQRHGAPYSDHRC
ncbi:MAG: hypothetical protein LBB18_03285 [Puniceicoccales bacterium]|jgi:hypothetical protein|nr:hypothetical protein [Puniceicoccales bacterium]